MRQPHDNVEGSVMVGLVEAVRNHGRRRMCWLDNICQCTGLSGDSLLHTLRDKRCFTSLTHPFSQPLRSDDGRMTWYDDMLGYHNNNNNNNHATNKDKDATDDDHNADVEDNNADVKG